MAVIASRQRGDERVDVVEFLARHLLAQFFEDVLRGVDADIGGQQPRFELVEHFGVDLATGHEVGEVIRKPRTRTIDLRAHARDEDLVLAGGFSAIAYCTFTPCEKKSGPFGPLSRVSELPRDYCRCEYRRVGDCNLRAAGCRGRSELRVRLDVGRKRLGRRATELRSYRVRLR